MARALSLALTTEMESLHRRHASTATVERWLPEWNPVISGLSTPKYEQYAHGHVAVVAPNANGAGEDILFRARSGKYSAAGIEVRDGWLYTQILKGADLTNPAGWESKWVMSDVSDVMRPAWTADSGAQYGGSIAAVWSGSYFRVFFLHPGGELSYADFNTSGVRTAWNIIASLGNTSFILASMQIASCQADEVFVTTVGKLENPTPTAGWQKPVYGSMIYRYRYNGSSWVRYDSFPFYTHAECALMRDSQFDYGGDKSGNEPNAWGSGSDADIIAQWGKRPCGGLAANKVFKRNASGVLVEDTNTVVVSAAFTFWRRYGYTTHNQGVFSFIYHRDSNMWERGFETGLSDYVTERLDYDAFVRGSQVGSSSWLVWSRNVEPSDYDQLETAMSLPRTREVVYAKLSEDGKLITQYQYLGPQDDLTSASLVEVNHAGSKYLYALGWRAVYKSDPAAFMGPVPSPATLAGCSTGWQTQINNRWGMSVQVNVENAGVLFAANSQLKAGRLIRVYAGMPGEQVQIAQGLIDQINPVLSLQQETHRAKVIARAEKGLLDPRAEEMRDVLPQQTVYIQPTDPIKNVVVQAGYWDVQPMEWPSKFFGSTYQHLQLQNAYRLLSFPYAKTGGDQGEGYPGMCLDQRPQHKGTWFNDVAWVGGLSPMVDGSIEASVRFGDMSNKSQASFWARNYGDPIYAQVLRQNGIIMGINWGRNYYGGPRFNPPSGKDAPWGVSQYALMAGLVVHAAEIGKKYAFVWECDSNFGGWNNDVYNGSSHTDDTWRQERFDKADYSAHGKGWNRLYLIESDYDEADPLWVKHNKWIHRSVAGGITATGLTPGYPADLKMIVIGGTIYCFYRPHHTYNAAPSQWRYAFQYEAARFGAGRFGIVGRGHAGVQWDDFFYAYWSNSANTWRPTGRDIIPGWDNYVDFWDIKASDCVMDTSMEEAIRRHAWQGFTPTSFNSLVSNVGPVNLANGGTTVLNTPTGLAAPVENLTIDFKVKLTVTDNEAGVIVRAVSSTLTNGPHFRLAITANGGLPVATGYINTHSIFRYYGSGGAHEATALQYGPFPLSVPINAPIPVRITTRGNIYSIWVAGHYAGHFIDDTAGGAFFGLYALGTNNASGYAAVFTEVRVPELYEVPEISSIEVNQTAFDALKKLLDERAIKGVFQPDGSVRVSYFETHDQGPSLMSSLKQSTLRITDRFASIVRVDGAYTFAVYASDTLLKLGRRFLQRQLPDIFHREFCYREAKNICVRMAEDQVQATFVGLPDLRIQPEDKIEIIVGQQNQSGHFLVDDVTIDYQAGDDPSMDTTISTRRFVVL